VLEHRFDQHMGHGLSKAQTQIFWQLNWFGKEFAYGQGNYAT
jgi:hypothetical protein